ncbi:MAG: zinc ribbon domain-containing protein [Eubacterium sp.]|nr:zinc ribbon domain-containing protein [Eubacterium sp.]
MTNKCPKCNAPLQENAQFCPHCMTVLTEKQTVEKKRKRIGGKKRIALIFAALVLVISVAASGVFTVIYKEKHSPLCSVEQLKAAAPLVSNKLGADGLWDPVGFIDIKEFGEEKIIQYTTDTRIGDALLSVFFYNRGEEVYAYFSDVTPENFNDAKKIIKCITISACNNYFKDIDDVFDDERLYPKKELEIPFRKGFTDLLLRTDKYNEDIANGAKISTKYIEITDGEFLITYCVTERADNGATLYDLAVEIEKN